MLRNSSNKSKLQPHNCSQDFDTSLASSKSYRKFIPTKFHLELSGSEFDSENCPDLDEMSSTERRRWEILKTPTDHCKYKAVWHRVRTKMLIRVRMMKLSKDIQLYGTSTVVENVLNRTRTRIIPKKSELKTVLLEDTEQHAPTVCILLPNSTIKNTWNVILAFLLIYTATIMPFRLAFIDGIMYDGWWFMDILIDGLFFLDILVNVNSAYLDTEGQLVTDRCKIFVKYLKTWLMLDIVACVPFNIISPEDDTKTTGDDFSDYNNLIRLLRLPRLYRLLRISRIFKMIKHYKSNDLLERIQEFLSVKNSKI